MDKTETAALREDTLRALNKLRREHHLCWRDYLAHIVTVLSSVIELYDLDCPDGDSELRP